MIPRDTALTRQRKLLLIMAFWTVVGVVYFGMSFFVRLVDGAPFDYEKAAWTMVAWWSWIPVSYPIFWLAERFPIDRARWVVNVPLHLAASVVASLASSLFYKAAQGVSALWTGTSFSFVEAMGEAFSSYVAFDSVVYMGMLAVAHALGYYERLREREGVAAELRVQLAEARLQTLKMQIQPHFLFNTFNSIAMLVRQRRDDEAVEMIAGLSGLFRYVLKHAEAQEVTLDQELDFLESYLAIERIRFEGPLELHREVTPEALRARVPSLLLQPLIENAIRHGIAPRYAGGLLRVEAWSEGTYVHICLCDNGAGLPEGWTLESCRGIGLSNTRERLDRLYGTDHVFRITSPPEGGTRLMLILPYRTFEAERPERPPVPSEVVERAERLVA